MTDDSKAAANRAARDQKKEVYLRAIYDRHIDQFRRAEKLDALSIAHSAHSAMDDVLQRDRQTIPGGENIRCGKGCSHCCREAVEIWPQEAALLVKVARNAGMQLDKARLERQSRYTMETWREQPAADKACGFLGSDGACTVYEYRPNACRKLLVVTDPALCNAELSKPDRVGRWHSWEAELMESAALEVFGAALMPAALLAVLHGNENSPG